MFDRALSLILLAYFGTVPAVAQEVPKVHYEAYIEEQSGKVILREISEDAEAGLASPSPKTQFPSGEMAATDEKAYALFDDSGSIRGVYPAPLTGADKEKLFDSIEQGGTLSMVSWFGDKISLPTTEQIEAVVSEATNGALRRVCSSDPLAEVFSVDVELAVALGLEGRFVLGMEWRPARDCVKR